MAFYFKKSVPQTPVWIAGGVKVTFETLDRVTGYKSVEMPHFADELRLAQRQGRGGVEEISAEEFERDFIKKKEGSTGLKAPWREEMGGGKSLDTVSATTPQTRPVAAVIDPKPASAPPTQSIPDNAPPVTRTPRVGRRSQAKLP